MGHSVKFQIEVWAKVLEAQAEKMFEQELIVRESGRTALADQILVQHERLLEAIAALRDLNK